MFRRLSGPAPLSATMSPATRSAVEELLFEAPDLHFITVGDLTRFDSPTVQVGAVQRSHVVDQVPVAGSFHLYKVAGHGDVVQQNVGAPVAADSRCCCLEPVACPGLGPRLHYE